MDAVARECVDETDDVPEQRRQVIGRGLPGERVAALVWDNHAVSGGHEGVDLVPPGIRRFGEPVEKHNRLGFRESSTNGMHP